MSHPHVTRSIHAPLLEQSIPYWVNQATPQHLHALKSANAPLPAWYREASRQQRKAFDESLVAHFIAQNQWSRSMAGLQDIQAFAEPRLREHLKAEFDVDLDVNHTFLHLLKPIEVGRVIPIEVGSFEVSQRTLLQAALHNFEEAECELDAYHRASGFVVKSAQSGRFEALGTPMTVSRFIHACRVLDIGGQYQQYLKAFVYPDASATQHAMREQFNTVQKTALRTAAERALLQKDIEPEDYTSILAIIQGERNPRQGEKRIGLCEMTLMNRPLTGCIGFAIGKTLETPEDLLLFIPDDPHHPLKRYKPGQVEATLKQHFTARGTDAGSPTAYQQFFSRFVAYADRPYFFSQFTVDAPDTPFISELRAHYSLISDVINGLSRLPGTQVEQLAPAPAIRQVANPEPFLAPLFVLLERDGDRNIDLWDWLFERHRQQQIADALSYAVPSATVDARERDALFDKLLNIGMLILGSVSMFVPVLGEVMMTLMACQLLAESIEGVVEWSEGDRQAAKAHLLDVAQNLLLLGLTASAGKGLSKLSAVEPTPVIEDLHPVTLPDGSARLCRSDMAGYEVPGAFDPDIGPDAMGRYTLDDRSFIRLEGKVYEQVFDRDLKRWRIRHPTDAQAYQPVLAHNAAGAWRHVLENPLSWSRLRLLRRMGHIADACSDEQLLTIADIAGVSDNALRRMHMDNRLPPPELADALRLWGADRDVTQVIEQVVSGELIDERYLHAVPMITELPRWPAGRILQIFERPGLSGLRAEYGQAPLEAGAPVKPPIRMSRYDVLTAQLPMRVLEALDEAEIVALLGAEAAQNRGWRAQALREQIAAHARTRRSLLFESFYRRNAQATALADPLQRVYPGLSDAAANEVLAHASAVDMAIVRNTTKVPRSMLREARWYARRGRLTRALAKLHMRNMLSADARRLAVHTLERLPGWSDEVRLEIREGSITGRLLDAIGPRTAAQRCHVVKKGPFYQAFNDDGEALNQPSASIDHFHAALLHALPAPSRQALGMPLVTDSPALQRAICRYATEHVEHSAAILEPQSRHGRAFRPPQRIRQNLVGYPASGEGLVGSSGLNVGLVLRLQHLYPDLEMAEANAMVLALLRAGQNDVQILQMLEGLREQWLTLEQTLEDWVTHGGDLEHKAGVALSLRNTWRGRPFAAENAAYRQLDLVCDEPLPALTADFSHVWTLRLRVPNSTDQQIRELLHNFSGLQYLDLRGNRLIVDPIAPQNAGRLRKLDLSDNPLYQFDVSAMTDLETLIMEGTPLQQWPRGADRLPRLSWLDLRGTLIRELPPEALARDELLINTNLTGAPLSNSARQQLQLARRRCESALGLPDGALHTFALEPVPDHAAQPFENGSLLASRLLPLPPALPAAESVPSFVGRLRRVDPSLTEGEALEVIEGWRVGADDTWVDAHVEEWGHRFEAITRQLNGWIFHRRTGSAAYGGRWTASERRSKAAGRIMACWKEGLNAMSRERVPTLDLSSIAGLGELPEMPTGFGHVQSLNLRGVGLNEADVHGFLPVFSGLRSLDLSLNSLERVPSAVAAMTRLQTLGLSSNRLSDLLALGQDLGAMAQLESLRLSYNRIKTFDGAGLQALRGLRKLEMNYNQMNRFVGPIPESLQSLHLNGNDLREWPEGVLQAPNLEELSLAGNPIQDIPQEAFDGNHDRLLRGTHLFGILRYLTTDTLERLLAHLDRVGGNKVLGISRDNIERWLANPDWAAMDASSTDSAEEMSGRRRR
ncbi:dermonecrotic toxin domain-containing protein [Pseudomonas sp. S2_C03]